MKHENTGTTVNAASERGFTLTELMITMVVFTIIMGSVFLLVSKSQAIFRTEQGVSEMDQNARLLIDFLTRDIQQSKENGLGLGSKFRSIHSYNGAEGKTDEITIISSDTESQIPAKALPLVPVSTENFAVSQRLLEVMPNVAAQADPAEVVSALQADEEFILSSTLQDGSVQFDFVRVAGARLTETGTIVLQFDAVEHRGIVSEIPFGSLYEGGSFTLRPVSIRRYYIDRKTDRDHPVLALSVNGSAPVAIARNVVAFQLRYLEQRNGEVEGVWSKEQNISPEYKTLAVEVTMTARTEIKGDPQAERLVTLASIIRPRQTSDGDFGASSGGGRSPGTPGDGGSGGGGGAGPGGDGGAGGGGFNSGNGLSNGNGLTGGGTGFGSGLNNNGYNHNTRRIGKQPKLGERLVDTQPQGTPSRRP